MDIKKYLQRIGAQRVEVDARSPACTVETLRFLQRQHLLHVPFENLDIHWKRPIALDTDSFYRKIVEDNRGGFCYELNGLFYVLLRDLGFRVKMVSARVAIPIDTFTPEFSHLAIIATIGEKKYLVDVGFGDFTAEPLELVLDVEQEDKAGIFRIRKLEKYYLNDQYFTVEKRDAPIVYLFGSNDKDSLKKPDKDTFSWFSEYIFTERARGLKDFSKMCIFQQTSPDSHFTQNKVCSLLISDGRKTLTDSKFIVTKDGERTENLLKPPYPSFNEILKQEFNIEPIN